MVAIIRVKMRWAGFIGGPGLSVFHFRDFGQDPPITADAQAAVDKVDNFAAAIIPLLSPSVSLQVESGIDVLEDSTGDLVGSLTAVPDAPRFGTSATLIYSSAVGACINWRTGLVRNSRRVRGRTFLVPLSGGVQENNGTLNAGTLTLLDTAATALRSEVGNSDLGVWARPTAPGASDGEWTPVMGHSVADKSAVLTSRRD